jgi:hypothetical protein
MFFVVSKKYFLFQFCFLLYICMYWIAREEFDYEEFQKMRDSTPALSKRELAIKEVCGRHIDFEIYFCLLIVCYDDHS